MERCEPMMSEDDRPVRGTPSKGTVVKAALVAGLTVWAFWPEITAIVRAASHRSDWAHALVAPFAILYLLHRRRRELAGALAGGSAWGVVLLLGGFGLYAVSTWPFDYAYPRSVAMLPVLAGGVLAAFGWRVLKVSLPMLLLLFLSVPIGARTYASLALRPEAYTLSAARTVLDQLPGVTARRSGPDLSVTTRSGNTRIIALGEPHRGASQLATYVAIGVFVVFARIRPFGQIVLLALGAVPIALLCNFLRVILWGAITIWAGPDPVNPMPRALCAVVSLVCAYVCFALACLVLSWFSAEGSEDDETEPGLVAAEGG
jgi:exosortase/archaeosortase family protein